MKKILFILIATILLNGCTKETTLQRSIFLEDPDYEGLPKYSEWGYNTFGAYFDRVPYVSTDGNVPAKFIVAHGFGSFVLDGVRRESGYAGSQKNYTLRFTIRDFQANTYADLLSLHKKTFDLTHEDIQVFLTINNLDYPADILEGELDFQRAQHLWLDGVSMQVILSGRFSFQAVVGGSPISLQSGRFDIAIMNDNFYRY